MKPALPTQLLFLPPQAVVCMARAEDARSLLQCVSLSLRDRTVSASASKVRSVCQSAELNHVFGVRKTRFRTKVEKIWKV